MSRKAKRKSGEPPGRETDSGAGKKSIPWALALGIVLTFLTLCLAQATVREIYIGLYLDDYVRDELVVTSMSNPYDDLWLHGEIVSSGESVWVPGSVAGPGFNSLRELQRQGRIKGHRIQVWYLPQETPWWFSGSNQIRVLHVSQLEYRFGGWPTAVAITVPGHRQRFPVRLRLKQIRGRRGSQRLDSVVCKFVL